MQILAGIILLGVLITFHELGHFLFAKWLGVRVLVFSVGFGPRLWGFRRGETEYRLSLIPLGGYVRMFGESLEEDLSDEEKKISFMHQAIWRKSLIAFAGPLFNFILPVILFFFLLVGTEEVFAPKVGTLIEGGVAARSGLMIGDTITEVNGTPVESFNDVADVIANNPGVDVHLQVRREIDGSVTSVPITVTPESKVSANPLEKDQAYGRIGIMPTVERAQVSVSAQSPLAALGLKNLDEILSMDGRPIDNAHQLQQALPSLKPSSVIVAKDPQSGAERTITVPDASFTLSITSSPPVVYSNVEEGEQARVTNALEKTKALLKKEQQLLVQQFGLGSARGVITHVASDSVAAKLGLIAHDRIVIIDGEPVVTSLQIQQAIIHDTKNDHVIGVIKHDGTAMVGVFSIPQDLVDKISLEADLLHLLGVSLAQGFKAGDLITRNVSVGEAMARATMQTVDIAVMTAKSIWLLVKRDVPASQIGGPIMLFDVASQAAQKGLAFYIFIMCLLSVNLGLLNLLPIPVLDGGHLLLFGIEAVQRKPLTARTRVIATQIGFALLLMLMLFAIWNDVSRLLK